ncbi:MAG: hypothetical protein P4L10_00005, partial [Acidobacteriaceae bacterium]|nr:hypothetical protein [Acidobacteriaceae bacterium]
MNQPYDPPRRDQSGPADLAGFLVLGGCAVLGVLWYIAVSRLHLRSDQCLEIFLDLVIGIFGIALLLSHFIGRREKREEMWPHPAVTIPGAKDAAVVEAAICKEATVLGYNVHKEPWLWPDSVRIKHGVIAGGTGAGKTTFLENIIAQDLQRRFGDRPMPMIIFDGKGDQEFLERLLP